MRIVASFLGQQNTVEFTQSIASDQLTVIAQRDFVAGVHLEITGELRNADGDALAGIRVFAPTSSTVACRVCETYTEYGTGRYRLELILPFNAIAPNVQVSVDGSDGMQTYDLSANLDPNNANTLEQNLEYAPLISTVIRGRITDRDGLPMENIVVDPYITSEWFGYGGSFLTDSAGNYQVEVRVRRSQPTLSGSIFVNLPNARPEFAFSFSINSNAANEVHRRTSRWMSPSRVSKPSQCAARSGIVSVTWSPTPTSISTVSVTRTRTAKDVTS
ncbi:MAG: hypothetical protein HC933_18980 [Pleurocapsa sp. SU_196_0]|nr:hypothetical protein [Pleurocapsa sp. SU_196_0]